ncbi:3-hydroxyacyl-CoA dehydrogenase [Alkalithermobacter thermoalcaliphilus JW-YL-7 = DSM 7308]|uniref:3-hydroxybutyryl-CoA dehydrogenase n=1 Tax=Alkalithermobacter thermoalcaliphilus JW-YL-7 = DSM 7308 TaxID=1121328 RepID=A0A150FR98_CLOPD|nr:3-hydroxybutyryl-CoA dehydrogenase [[Clostridium] paradoxum JW-YL-7 = DSM 7308]SHK45322.1 3-hydroxyacyl-CoA dehydrogenase [[Clostridium] paradoxum JW-YL-7 = DSM 7308]
MKVAVIGSGTMGCGIAQVFIENEFEVILKDIDDECLKRGKQIIEKNLDKKIRKGKMTYEDKNKVMNNLTLTKDLQDLKNVDLVIEAVSENMDIKKEIFRQLDNIVNDKAIFATNTSTLSITEMAFETTRPDRFIGMHFFNPAQVMKLVEVISTVSTSNEIEDKILKLCRDIQKTPVKVNESPGFIVNRLLIPMINEAIGVLSDNVATKEEIDTAMKLGAAHPMGPLELSDLIGNDVVLNIMEILYKEFGDDKYRPHPLLRKMVRANQLGRKTKKGFYEYE